MERASREGRGRLRRGGVGVVGEGSMVGGWVKTGRWRVSAWAQLVYVSCRGFSNRSQMVLGLMGVSKVCKKSLK